MPRTVPSLSPWGPGRRLAYGALLGVLVGGLLALLRGTHALEALELRLVDVRTRAFVGQRAPDPRIVLCLVRNADHVRVRQSDVGASSQDWPWQLYVHEYAMRALAAARPQAVVVDMLYVDRGIGPDDLTVEDADREQGWYQQLIAQAGQAEELGKAYAEVGPVVLGFQTSDTPTAYEQPARVADARARARLGDGFAPEGGKAHAHATLPVRGLLGGVRALGFTNVEPDVDGVQRRARVLGRWGDLPVASLPLAGAWLATPGPHEARADAVRLGEAEQRLDEEQGFYVSFRGMPGVYREVKVADLVSIGAELVDGKKTLEELAQPARDLLEALRGAIVVYGAHLDGAEDIVGSPLDGAHLGPEYQATILDNLLHGDGRVRVGRGGNTALLLGLCALAGALGTFLRGRWWPHLPALALLGLLVALGYGLFARGRVIDLVTPATGLLLTWGGAAALRLTTEGRRNKWLESTFGRYVSPDVIAALKRDPSLLALGGRRRDLTLFFSDVAGFTGISERLGAEEVVRLLNAYLTTQASEVMQAGGVIDKFMGDGVMAFFGDPLETPDHALRGVRAALRCQAALPTLAPIVGELGLPPLVVRIGLSSGPAVVGNMGSADRFSYTCMGDTVNLASRIEGANKAFGSRILVTAPTYLMVREQVVYKRLADLQVVGRKEPVRVYEILSLREDASPDLVAHASAFARAHEALRRGDLEAAGAALAEAERLRPGDGPTAWLAALAARMRAGSAPTPWDGAWSLTEK